MAKEEKTVKRQIKKVDEAKQVSWDDQTEIEGLYVGLKPFLNESGDLMYIAFFKDEVSGELSSCVASYKIQEFLKIHKFKKGFYLKIIKTETIDLPGGKRLNKFAFEFDENGCGLKDVADQFLDIEDVELEVISNFDLARQKVKAMKTKLTEKSSDETDDLAFLDEKD